MLPPVTQPLSTSGLQYQLSQKKEATKTLKGIIAQIQKTSEKFKDVFDENKEFIDHLKAMSDHGNFAKNLFGITKPSKIDFPTELEKIQRSFMMLAGKLKNLDEQPIDAYNKVFILRDTGVVDLNKLTEEVTKKITDLSDFENEFNKLKHNCDDLLKKTSSKISKLKAEKELRINFPFPNGTNTESFKIWIKKAINRQFVDTFLNESFDKHNEKMTQLENLIELFYGINASMNDISYQLVLSNIKTRSAYFLESCNHMVLEIEDKLKENFTFMNSINLNTLQPKSFNQEDFKKAKDVINKNSTTLALLHVLQNKISEWKPILIGCLKEINEKPNSINVSKIEKNFCAIKKNEMRDKKEIFLVKLNQEKKFIIDEWHTLSVKLDNAIYCMEFFNLMINPWAEVASIYLKIVEISQRISTTNRISSDKNKHVSEYDEQTKEYLDLEKKLFLDASFEFYPFSQPLLQEPALGNLGIMDADESEFSLLLPLFKNFITTLKNLSKAIDMKFCHSGNLELPCFSMVSTSKQKEDKLEAALMQQRAETKIELQKMVKNLFDGFTDVLNKEWKITVTALNDRAKALNRPEDFADFREAYNEKTTFQKVMEFGSSFVEAPLSLWGSSITPDINSSKTSQDITLEDFVFLEPSTPNEVNSLSSSKVDQEVVTQTFKSPFEGINFEKLKVKFIKS